VAVQQIKRQLRLDRQVFLSLSALLSISDLIATLPRHIGKTLARAAAADATLPV
jgi:hypothetical protein